MRVNYKHIALSLCTASLMTALALSGCSDNDRSTIGPDSPGGDRPSAHNKYELLFDTDHDMIPDVFEYRDGNGKLALMEGVSYIKGKAEAEKGISGKVVGITTAKAAADKETHVSNAPAWIASSVVGPYIHEYYDEDVEEGDAPVLQTEVVNTPDIHLFQLEGGKAYTLTLHDADQDGDYVGEFMPSIRVVAKEELEENESAPGLELTVIDEGVINERTMSVHFTPQKSGVYSIVVRDITADTIADKKEDATSHEYGFTIYPDEQSFGHYTLFKSFDGDAEYVYTPEEIFELRNILKPYLKYDEETGQVVGYNSEKFDNQTAEECFNDARDLICDLYAIDDTTTSPDISAKVNTLPSSVDSLPSVNESKLEPSLKAFPWDELCQWGDGVFAINGMSPELKNGAVKDFKLTPSNVFTGTTTMKVVDSETKHLDMFGIDTKLNVAGSRMALGVSNKYTKEVKYGSTTCTLMITYNFGEKEARWLPKLSDYQLTEEASKYLQENGETLFRKRYGDYFVGGAMYGSRYIGMITITTTNSEKLSELKNTINFEFNKAKEDAEKKGTSVKLDNEITKKIQDVAKNTTIELHEICDGGSYDTSKDDVKSGPAAFDTLLKHYQSFQKRAEDPEQKHNFAPLTAVLVGYHQITGGIGKLKPVVPYSPDNFAEIQGISNLLLKLKANVKDYMSLPSYHFVDGGDVKRKYEESISRLDLKIKSNMDAIIENEKTRTAYLNALVAENRVLTNQMGRYQLFRALEDAAVQTKGQGLRYQTYGFDCFLRYPEVSKDIHRANSEEIYEKPWVAHRHYKEYTFEAPGSWADRCCYFMLKNKGRYDYETKNATLSLLGDSDPLLSRSSFKVRIVSGLSRGLYMTYEQAWLDHSKYDDFAWTYR